MIDGKKSAYLGKLHSIIVFPVCDCLNCEVESIQSHFMHSYMINANEEAIKHKLYYFAYLSASYCCTYDCLKNIFVV